MKQICFKGSQQTPYLSLLHVLKYLINSNCRSSGLIVGGLDRGFISVYDASKIINGNGENALVFSKDKHTGQVCLPIYSPPFSDFIDN